MGEESRAEEKALGVLGGRCHCQWDNQGRLQPESDTSAKICRELRGLRISRTRWICIILGIGNDNTKV